MTRNVRALRGSAAAGAIAITSTLAGLAGASVLPVAAAAPAVVTRPVVGSGRPAPANAGPSAAQLAMSGPPASTLAGRGAPREQAATTTGPTVTIEGHGAGGGIGMGQYGAFGYASERGYHWTYEEIVGHFYGRTHLEPLSPAVDDRSIAVNLSELDGAASTRVRVVASGASLSVDGKRQKSPYTVTHTAAAKTVTVSSGDIDVDLPGVGWRAYKGSLQIQGGSGATAGQTWNIVPLEDYVAGVVPAESIASWGAEGGEAALEAQAVAARSYGLSYVVDVGRTCDISVCQVYAGDPADNPAVGSDARYAEDATAATAGKVMCSAATSPCPPADVVSTEYSASTGGYTAPSSFGAVVDAGDAVASNPFHSWSAATGCPTRFPASELTSAYGLGTLTAALVTSRDGHGAWGGRVVEVRLSGTARTVTVTGDSLAATLGLCSTWFLFSSI